MKILNFGSCNIDYVYEVGHIVTPGETLPSERLSVFSGGKGLNQSIAVARAGEKVYHAGCIGTDGKALKELLQENGVDVSYLKTLSDKTGHAIIQLSEKGENSIVLYGGCNEAIEKEFINEVLDGFEKGDILILQNEINNIAYIVDEAYERGLTIAFNPAPFKETVKEIDLKKISILILNEIEARGLVGKDTPEENVKALQSEYPNAKIVLTVGAKGAMYADETQTVYQSSFCVPVKDTTAAGDTFIGYFIASLVQEKQIGQALKSASAAAALTVSRKGAAVSIPFAKEVEEALKVLKTNSQNTGKAEELKEKIDRYFLENLQTASVAGLAQAIGYSAEYTGVLVKRVTGKTFSTLLQSKRFSLAEKLLSETDSSVQEIIYQCGYENETFFRKIFKERYGKLPLEYRKYKRGEIKKD